MSDDELLAWLDAGNVPYRRLDGRPGADPEPDRAKSLLVRDRRDGRYLLVVGGRDQRVDLQRLARALGVRRLRFASEEELARLLGTVPGRVGLLALANDPQCRVEVLIDAAVWRIPVLRCPLPASALALAIDHAGIERLLAHAGHAVQVRALPAPPGADGSAHGAPAGSELPSPPATE